LCELLGLCFNREIRPNISFRAFRMRADGNPDGWGIAFYPDPPAACVIKEELSALRSELADFIAYYPKLRSRIFICHVRWGTTGSVCYRNAHPFVREVFGRDYVFAHNGVIRGFGRLKLGRFRPIGNTDSEHVFCYILGRIYDRGIQTWGRDEFEWLHEMLLRINRLGSLNCMMSDGEYLFCYTDADGYNTLCYVRREPPYPRIKLRDLDWEIDLNLTKKEGQIGYIIATYPLTDEQWKTFSPGELVVFRRGEIIYRSHREEDLGLSQIDIDILRIIRRAPRRVKLRKIIMRLGNLYGETQIKQHIKYLLCHQYIRQDGRDGVRWSHPEATFYTNLKRRAYIDRLLAENSDGR